MAKYRVKKYVSNIIDIGGGSHKLLIICDLENDSETINTHYYRIADDTNAPDLKDIKLTIDNGFSEAMSRNKSIEISINAVRRYINITLPDKDNKNQQYQFTGIKMNKLEDLGS